jgi:3-oxoacyl-[acyl-carrier-protein] synthase-1
VRDPPTPASYAITAYALGNGLGATTAEVAAALRAGRSGLSSPPFDLPFETTCGVFPAELERLPPSLAAFDSRSSRMALVVLDQMSGAVERAVQRWGRDRIAVLIGTSTGGILESEKAYAIWAEKGRLPATFDFDHQHAFHGLLCVISARTGAAGPSYVVSTACSSGGKVLGSARRLLASGLADAALVGGVDTLCDTTLRGFGSLEALSRRPCRPFSALRDGTSIGEGAAFMLIEREGNGPVRLLGVGESSDAFHMTQPHPDGLGARLAMERALQQAGVEAGAVDHVNAHGTGTPANDLAEAKAILTVVGAEVPVVSTKGYTGHLLGAAGATEALFSAMAIENSFVPSSLGASPIDPAIGIDICLTARAGRVDRVLSNSFAFGGSNVSVLLGAEP